MDAKEQYKELTEIIKENLPLKAFPIRELVHIFRDKGEVITLKTEITITDVMNTGDITGILCVIKTDKDQNLACALTHLIFSRTCPLFKEISEYQRKSEKRIRKLNQMGLN